MQPVDWSDPYAERLSGDRAEISLNRAIALRLLGDADAAELADSCWTL